MSDIQQTPEERFAAVLNVTTDLEDGFLTAGELLHAIKQSKTFRFKGYEKFKDFVESEYGVSASFANKIVGVYDEFVVIQDKDVNDLHEIGLEKLHLIKPLVKKEDWKVKEEWYQKAIDLTLPDLKAEIKAFKDKDKAENLDMKDVLISQWKERMLCLFNCSWKELQFKLALWFTAHDSDFDAVLKDEVRKLQVRYEQEVIAHEGNAEKASQHMTDAVKEFQQTCQDISDKYGATISTEFGDQKVVVSSPTQDPNDDPLS